jgi:hypothetical protein
MNTACTTSGCKTYTKIIFIHYEHTDMVSFMTVWSSVHISAHYRIIGELNTCPAPTPGRLWMRFMTTVHGHTAHERNLWPQFMDIPLALAAYREFGYLRHAEPPLSPLAGPPLLGHKNSWAKSLNRSSSDKTVLFFIILYIILLFYRSAILYYHFITMIIWYPGYIKSCSHKSLVKYYIECLPGTVLCMIIR